MEIKEARKLAKELMDEHLAGHPWRLQFGNELNNAGKTYYRRSIIELSRHYVKLNDEPQVKDTILHEIAHALNWIRNRQKGHRTGWKKIAEEIGAKPERLDSEGNYPEPEWIRVCSKCGKGKKKMHRRVSTRNYVSSCCQAKLEYKRNPEH